MGRFLRLWTNIRRRGVPNVFGTPTTIPGLFLAFVVASAVAWSAMLFSWWLLALRSRLVRGYAMSTLYGVEAASACVAAVGHFVLLYFAVYGRLPQSWLLACARRDKSRHALDSAGWDSHLDSRRASWDGVPSVGGAVEEEGEGKEPHQWGDATVSAAPSAVAVPLGDFTGLQQRMASRLSSSESGMAGSKLGFSRWSSQRGHAAGAAGGNATTNASSGSRKAQGRQTRVFPYLMTAVVGLVCLMHLVIHQTIPDAHRQSQEILLMLIRICLDVVLLAACEIFVALRLKRAARGGAVSRGRGRVSYVRVTLYLCGAVLFAGSAYVLMRFLWLVHSVDTLEHLSMGVMGSSDLCALENMRMRPEMASSWVWPALTHRRLFNFWTGSEVCSHASGLPPLSLVVPEEKLLLVSPQCPDGARPHVYLHRPENSEFTGSPDVHLPETQRGNAEYHRQLEALFGTAAAAELRGVLVRRDAESGRILSVEVDPKRLPAREREPRSTREREVRQAWPGGGSTVLAVPLGYSAAYTVYCQALDHEEYHLYPLDDAVLDDYSGAAPTTQGERKPQCVPWWKRAGRAEPPPPLAADDEPAGNVLIMLMDAVSRQEIYRSLPKFRQELTKFSRNHSHGYHVVEAHGAMTLGINTAANLVPIFAGVTAKAVGLTTETRFTNVSFMDRTLFVRAKEKYGDAISTAFTSAFCHDLLEYLMGHTDPSSGAGGRVRGLDRYTYSPFCHLDYSGVHSNFRGPYSIVRRCMAGEAVWEHMVNYTAHVVERHLKGSRRAADPSTHIPVEEGDCDATMPGKSYGRHFFHVMYMTEGHEGTHGVFPLVDGSLARFFADLRDRQRFFDNPRNTFILLADHGNHMGHYNAYTHAGEFERGTPPALIIVHEQVLSRIDRKKNNVPGAPYMNLRERTKRVSTPMDIYLTLADLLNVRAEVHDAYNAPGLIHPASLFDERDAASADVVASCSRFSSAVEKYPCPLDYCEAIKKPLGQ